MLGNLIKLGGAILLAREAADVIDSARHYQKKEIQKTNTANAVTGALIGMAVGAGIGILFAPRSGKETREIISDAASEQMENFQNQLTERKKQFDEVMSKGKEEICADAEEVAE